MLFRRFYALRVDPVSSVKEDETYLVIQKGSLLRFDKG